MTLKCIYRSQLTILLWLDTAVKYEGHKITNYNHKIVGLDIAVKYEDNYFLFLINIQTTKLLCQH